MKKRAFISFVSILFAVMALSQPSLLWESSFNGAVANDQGNAIAIDGGGNVYVTGATDETTGASDYLTIKYNADGDILWSRTYNGAANGLDEALAIKVDAAGNVYVTGRSQGTGSAFNIVTIKYNSDGVQQWVAIVGNGFMSIGYNLVVDVFGNVYVAGGKNAYDGHVIIKYNSQGVSQWSRDLYGSYENKSFVAINPNDGNIIVTGGKGLYGKYYLHALNPSNGNTVQSYNTAAFYNIIGIPHALALDGVGNMYVTSSSTVQTSSVPTNVTTTKFTYASSSTSYAWAQSSNYGGIITGVDMKLDNYNNIYVLSKYYDGSNYRFFTKKLGPDGAQAWQTPTYTGSNIEGTPVSLSLSSISDPPDIYVAGYSSFGDLVTIKHNNNGDTLWTKIYDCGNNGADIAAAMVMDDCDNMYITGSSSCNGTFKDVKTIKYSTIEPPAITPAGPIAICPGSSVTLTSSAASSYEWSTGASTQSITVSSEGDYSVTVTNANGCQSSAEISVSAMPSPTASIAPGGQVNICQGNSVELTASEASAYLWSTGATTQSITVSSAGNYWVTVTNSAGCSAVSPATSVVVQPAPVATITPNGPTTFCDGGEVTLTASQAATYLWSTGATTPGITVTSSGSYTVTITNAFGCSAASAATSVVVLPLPAASVSPGGTVAICENSSTTLTASPSNASAYLWSNGATTPGITVSSAGSYWVTVTNAGCSAVSPVTSVIISPPPAVSIATSTGSNTFCEGNAVVLTASPANTYQWNTGATTQSISVSTAGDYSVTVTNTAGCVGSAGISVSALPVATITLLPTPTSCDGADGHITLSISGGSPIISYLWSNGVTTSNPTNLPGGTYSVTATDINGCQVTAEATVVGRVSPTVDLGPDITIEQGQEAVLTATATGEGLTYVWSTGETTPTITVENEGDYSVTVTNVFECSASDMVSVTIITSKVEEPTGLSMTVSPNPAREILYIKCEGRPSTMARVMDVFGRPVVVDRSFVPDGATRTIHLDKVPDGVYFLEVFGEGFRRVVTVVKGGD